MSMGQRFRDADEALRLRLIPYNTGTLSSDHPPGYNFLVLCLLPYREKKKKKSSLCFYFPHFKSSSWGRLGAAATQVGGGGRSCDHL